MEWFFEWLWSKYGPRFRWAVIVALSAGSVGAFLVPAVLAFGSYFGFEDAWIVVLCWLVVMPVASFGLMARAPGWDAVEGWARGDHVDPSGTSEAVFALSRSFFRRFVVVTVISVGVILSVSVAAVSTSPTTRLEWLATGLGHGLLVAGIGMHFAIDVWFRPVRRELSAASPAVGWSPPPGRSYVKAMTLLVLSTTIAYGSLAAWLAVHIDASRDHPLVPVSIVVALAVLLGVPNTLLLCVAPALSPIRDLTDGIERVRAGNTLESVPVTNDDDLGVLAAQFNQMQTGLTERERLRSAFGSYVDPALASRLLEQGSDVFAGEYRPVTVLFIDIRDFTAFADANSAEGAVAHLNALFEIVVPAVQSHGGHVNKYLGDGALAVFGAPNDLDRHADAAVDAATSIQRLVHERFEGSVRVGMGINTGPVIAGTIGGGGKLEFTLIGDTVNVAARVEQLCKTTGDGILLTQQTVDALRAPLPELIARGAHDVKGKSEPVIVHALVVAAGPPPMPRSVVSLVDDRSADDRSNDGV